MENILLNYLIDCFNKASRKAEFDLLPFITISRTHGCNANHIADLLVKKLNGNPGKEKGARPWHPVSKEILETAAKELHISNDRILRIYRNEWHGFIEETLESFMAKYYKHDTAILKTLDRVIKDIASKGNVIILGRGGFEVTKRMKSGFHVFLTAPIEWRVHRVMELENIRSRDEAYNHTRQVDAQRQALKHKLGGIHFDDFAYSVVYDCEFFSPEAIADSIVHLMKSKGMIA